MITLANAIIQQDIQLVRQLLQHGYNPNDLDEYGFTALIEACIVNNIDIAKLLIESGALINLQDATGGTPLSWAVENNNHELIQLLLSHRANPNTYTFSGQPVLVMPTLRRQKSVRQLLVKAGANETFAYDFINTKLLGHFFELVGFASIISPANKLVDVEFEGFFLEVTLGLVADSLTQFQHHFASRQLRRYANISQFIVDVIRRSMVLMHYQKHFARIEQYANDIDPLLREMPLLIPVGYEGHAITFILHGDIWIKCDRREDSRLYDNIMFYRIKRKEAVTLEFLKNLFYRKQSSQFINMQLDKILDLEPITELKIEAQISGNCSWANVEAVIPALFYLVLRQYNADEPANNHLKNLSLQYFNRWREWNKERALQYCIRSFEEGDVLRKASKAEILATILFQRLNSQNRNDHGYIDSILHLLINSPYEYLLRNYVKVYYYEKHSDEGKRFFDLLKNHGMRF